MRKKSNEQKTKEKSLRSVRRGGKIKMIWAAPIGRGFLDYCRYDHENILDSNPVIKPIIAFWLMKKNLSSYVA